MGYRDSITAQGLPTPGATVAVTRPATGGEDSNKKKGGERPMLKRIFATLLLFMVVATGLVPTPATAASPATTLGNPQVDAAKLQATIATVHQFEPIISDELENYQKSLSKQGVKGNDLFIATWLDVSPFLGSISTWEAYLANLRECQRVKALAQRLPPVDGNRLMKVWAALGYEAWALNRPFSQQERFAATSQSSAPLKALLSAATPTTAPTTAIPGGSSALEAPPAPVKPAPAAPKSVPPAPKTPPLVAKPAVPPTKHAAPPPAVRPAKKQATKPATSIAPKPVKAEAAAPSTTTLPAPTNDSTSPNAAVSPAPDASPSPVKTLQTTPPAGAESKAPTSSPAPSPSPSGDGI